MRRLGWWLALSAAWACSDPVRERELDLGPESPGVPRGPLHRPGQPCVVCHGGEGPADTEFLLAGTLYLTPERSEPVADAVVLFIDSSGAQLGAVTNCAGNFFVRPGDWDPRWPVWTKVTDGEVETEMQSAIFRQSSCADCHLNPPGPSRVGHVYLVDDEQAPAREGCR